jgi:hypothetical protein
MDIKRFDKSAATLLAVTLLGPALFRSVATLAYDIPAAITQPLLPEELFATMAAIVIRPAAHTAIRNDGDLAQA